MAQVQKKRSKTRKRSRTRTTAKTLGVAKLLIFLVVLALGFSLNVYVLYYGMSKDDTATASAPEAMLAIASSISSAKRIHFEWNCTDDCSCLPPERDDNVMYMHQSYKTTNTTEWPAGWSVFRESWLERHTAWVFIFWLDEHNELLAQCMGYSEMYSGRSFIQKADLARHMYLQKFGGFYCDMDYLALQNQEPLIRSLNQDVLLQGRTHQVVGFEWGYAREPNHPIFQHCLSMVSKKSDMKDKCAIFVTGPKLLTRCLRSFYKLKQKGLEHMKSYDGLMIVKPELIAPIVADDLESECGQWRNSSQSHWERQWSKSACRQQLLHQGSYAVTVYSHSWGDGFKC